MKKRFIGKCEYCEIRYIPKTHDYHKHCKDVYNKTLEDVKALKREIIDKICFLDKYSEARCLKIIDQVMGGHRG